MAKPLTADELCLLYHHIFLPPQLPQESDEAEPVCKLILQLSLDALRALQSSHQNEYPVAVAIAITALENLQAANSLDQGATSESELSRILTTLEDGQTAPVLVGHQNAAILCTKNGHSLVFEAFELSPSNSEVMKASGRLIRHFPGATVAINAIMHAELLPVVAKTLSTMCHGAVPEMQPRSSKAGDKHEEHRDTTDPAIVTELFIGFLRGLGDAANISGVCKHTRDEVLWSNTLAPWRRSPMWLLIRVTLHLLTKRSSNGADRPYKRIMLYILSYLMDLAQLSRLLSDPLYAMSAKIVRRLRKLRLCQDQHTTEPDLLFSHIENLLKRTSDLLSRRWLHLQKSDVRTLDLNSLSTLHFEQDTLVKIPSLENYIRAMQSHPAIDTSKSCHLKDPLKVLDHAIFPSLPSTGPDNYHRMTATLQQVEHWIASNIDNWVQSDVADSETACKMLSDFIVEYHRLAACHYAGNPEGMSVMILTIFELWVACDKIAVRTCPMLADYPPDVHSGALQSLLCPYKDQMQRLSKMEAYLMVRSKNSNAHLRGLLFDVKHRESFAARYFETSTTHRELRAAIEQKARDDRESKHAEFQKTKTRYEQLDDLYQQTECYYEPVSTDNRTNLPETETRHVVSRCKKCAYQKERDKLQITIHEWPLPEDSVWASVVVFELNVPSWYSAWRDARLFLLVNTLGGISSGEKPDAKYSLVVDPHLSSRSIAGRYARVGLVSEVKPQVNSHYRTKNIASSNIEDVCVKNGLQYKYHDGSFGQFIGSIEYTDAAARLCTYTLPLPEMQKFISRSSDEPNGQPPNLVLASQDKCSSTMSIGEYKELCSVPLGARLQWPNMLLQLAMPCVDFRKEVTTLVFMQCIYQSGPPGENVLREAHSIFSSEKVALDFVHHLDVAVERVKRNWESAQALSLFTAMTCRVLSLNQATKQASLSLLSKIRNIARDWMVSLRDLAYGASGTSQNDRTFFLSKCVEIALICASTYDLEDYHLFELLSDPLEASMLIQAAITVHQGENSRTWNNSYMRIFRLRLSKLLHRCYSVLASDNKALNDAVKRSWSAYTPGTAGWALASNHADYVVVTWTRPFLGVSILVQIDLLSGELLVNGLPVDQPPVELRNEPLYSTLFGNATVEVMPATVKGFQFSSKRTFGGYQVQLGERDGKLLVQASQDGERIENVPSETFADIFPSHFIEDFVHWYNFTTGNVELRPVQDPFNQHSPETWILKKISERYWKMIREGHAVVGLQSATAKAMAKIFDPLSDHHRVQCFSRPADQTLRIEIPKLHLGFWLQAGTAQLRSKDMPSFVIKSRQELKTLIGFENKLLLESSNGDQMLLLPEGEVSCKKYVTHSAVKLTSKDDIRKVHAVKIDTLLNRLIDDGDLAGKFYLAYIHALTSFCLPDPFTCTTGTEQALEILRSSAARSFERLSQTCIDTRFDCWTLSR